MLQIYGTRCTSSDAISEDCSNCRRASSTHYTVQQILPMPNGMKKEREEMYKENPR
jgi:hypothetical protein